MGNPKLYLVDKLCGKPNWSNEQEYTVCALVGFLIYLHRHIREVHLCVPTNKSSTTPNLSERKSYDVRLLFISNFAIGFLLFNAITRIPQFKQIAKCKHLFTSIQAPFIAKKSICCVIKKSQ